MHKNSLAKIAKMHKYQELKQSKNTNQNHQNKRKTHKIQNRETKIKFRKSLDKTIMLLYNTNTNL